jgi:hypothetical protein
VKGPYTQSRSAAIILAKISDSTPRARLMTDLLRRLSAGSIGSAASVSRVDVTPDEEEEMEDMLAVLTSLSQIAKYCPDVYEAHHVAVNGLIVKEILMKNRAEVCWFGLIVTFILISLLGTSWGRRGLG